MIPLALLSRMNTYEIPFGHDANVKVNVIDHPSILEEKFSEFKNQLQNRVVGVGYEFKQGSGARSDRWLLLCGGGRCLMMNMQKLPYLESLAKFLADESICFVGLNQKVKGLMNGCDSLHCETFVELGYLAARVLKKSGIRSCGLDNLAAEVGIDVKPKRASLTDLDWAEGAIFFSEEQIKCAIYDVYYCFLIGDKLLSML